MRLSIYLKIGGHVQGHVRVQHGDGGVQEPHQQRPVRAGRGRAVGPDPDHRLLAHAVCHAKLQHPAGTAEGVRNVQAVLPGQTLGPAADAAAAARYRVHERRVLRRQGREGKRRGWLQQYRRRGVRFRSTLVDGAWRAPEARPAAVHVPDVRADAVQQPGAVVVRRDPAGDGHPRQGPDPGAAVAVDGQAAAASAGADAQDQGHRADERVLRERRVRVQVPQGQNSNGGRQGRVGTGAEGNPQQGGRGPQARDRGRDREDHEGAQEDGPQSAGIGCDHPAQEPVHAVPGDHQEENRGPDRARVSGSNARGPQGLCVSSLNTVTKRERTQLHWKLQDTTHTYTDTHIHAHKFGHTHTSTQ
uniref:(northern house mosquito) hypothetical protein n=1 Tax=Culex pipiens TaxID=7175 RepID=A0A8D8BHW2_CULPI